MTDKPRGWDRNPDYEIAFDRIPARVKAVFGGETVAESDNAHVMFELGHAPVYYLPRDDVNAAILLDSDHSTYCPYKGEAAYWTVSAGGKQAENALWTYPKPDPELPWLENYIGIYWGRMDGWFEDGEAVAGPREIPGRIDTENQLKKLFPELAAEWHPTRNPGIKPYEFAPDSGATVWWQDNEGREWQAPIRERVLALTRTRADGDANPYG